MSFSELAQIAGSMLFALSGGSAIVFALSKWLGGVWAGRILENERATLAREHELLVRRRDVYSELAESMRVFLASNTPSTQEQRDRFLSAYDLAALWADEEVVSQLSKFLDLHIVNAVNRTTEGDLAAKRELVSCITVMRRDCGFPNTRYTHRLVSF